MAAPAPQAEAHAQLKEQYIAYYHTPDPQAKRTFYSSQCRQICRSDPSYAAQNPDEIVAYLYDSVTRFKDLISTAPTTKNHCTTRPLTSEESADFGTLEVVVPAGFASVEELRLQAREEEWVGMRVDLWQDDGKGTGMLVKVHYWWRREGGGDDEHSAWKQILHDILYLGRVDGTQGTQGEISA
jgi:hypothetical protein